MTELRRAKGDVTLILCDEAGKEIGEVTVLSDRYGNPVMPDDLPEGAFTARIRICGLDADVGIIDLKKTEVSP